MLNGVDKVLVVFLYIDDLIYMGDDKSMFNEFKKSMMKEFNMTYLRLMHYFLGIEVVQSVDGIFISQKKYALEILDRFIMKNYNFVSIPFDLSLKLIKEDAVNATLYKQIVGSLMYLPSTRLDIMYAVSLISIYNGCPTESHLLVIKRIF